MSSLKNLVKTRTYRERSQPKARAKLGMLEKHKDYKLRAVDFHRKEDALKKMKEKAALKNPDEFYFNMVRTKQVGVGLGLGSARSRRRRHPARRAATPPAAPAPACRANDESHAADESACGMRHAACGHFASHMPHAAATTSHMLTEADSG